MGKPTRVSRSRSFPIERTEDVERAPDTVRSDRHERYFIGYGPSHAALDLTWQQIEVRTPTAGTSSARGRATSPRRLRIGQRRPDPSSALRSPTVEPGRVRQVPRPARPRRVVRPGAVVGAEGAGDALERPAGRRRPGRLVESGADLGRGPVGERGAGAGVPVASRWPSAGAPAPPVATAPQRRAPPGTATPRRDGTCPSGLRRCGPPSSTTSGRSYAPRISRLVRYLRPPRVEPPTSSDCRMHCRCGSPAFR